MYRNEPAGWTEHARRVLDAWRVHKPYIKVSPVSPYTMFVTIGPIEPVRCAYSIFLWDVRADQYSLVDTRYSLSSAVDYVYTSWTSWQKHVNKDEVAA